MKSRNPIARSVQDLASNAILVEGCLPISNGPALEGFVDHVLKILRYDFLAFAELQSEARVERTKRAAEEADDNLLHGFRNADIRSALYGDTEDDKE